MIIINENFLSAHPFYASDFQFGTHVTSPYENIKMYYYFCSSQVAMETKWLFITIPVLAKIFNLINISQAASKTFLVFMKIWYLVTLAGTCCTQIQTVPNDLGIGYMWNYYTFRQEWTDCITQPRVGFEPTSLWWGT